MQMEAMYLRFLKERISQGIFLSNFEVEKAYIVICI